MNIRVSMNVTINRQLSILDFKVKDNNKAEIGRKEISLDEPEMKR